MKAHWHIILLIIFLIFIGIRIISNKLWFKSVFHQAILKLPIIGTLVKSIETSRFCHIMTLMTSAHSPLVQSLNMIHDMITFIPLKKSILSSVDEITAGNSLNSSLSKSGFFDKKFISLIRASEEVNQLEYAFEKLNSQLNEEIDHRLKIMEKLLEPILIVIVGAMVAIILIAMYLPLFEIGGAVY